MDEFIEWYCSEPRLSFSRTVVVRYRMHLESRKLAPGTVNLRLGAVRRLAYEASDCGLLSPDLAAGIRRLVATPIYYSRLPTRVLIGFMMITADAWIAAAARFSSLTVASMSSISMALAPCPSTQSAARTRTD
jgi:hypothetical protein